MLQTKLIYEARCASPDSCAKAAAGKKPVVEWRSSGGTICNLYVYLIFIYHIYYICI